ncbi:hypothetical protein WK57_17235 [Burkholderia ubonensis]|uniref:Uncharacterized protein n=2 Tax=Burkholderia ubonensis TaxID=101571 RepID=A0A106PZY6_9BURK|nr:hypothetical protein WL16_26190 [Burkholderia ubonensis]KWA77333.1 hypothetical protein WL29_34860 [Burkholderia ubonensis]KWC09734.1 hypothetical protein WL43_11535 [Burkholderia ubonensis]KWZ58368.1 hypothetical protein WK57_17850 [Burkholderia ubonensis]KWZ58807.1 hypothetical protein WK57_17235 [Burkholderia ubonensis]
MRAADVRLTRLGLTDMRRSYMNERPCSHCGCLLRQGAIRCKACGSEDPFCRRAIGADKTVMIALITVAVMIVAFAIFVVLLPIP